MRKSTGQEKREAVLTSMERGGSLGHKILRGKRRVKGVVRDLMREETFQSKKS